MNTDKCEIKACRLEKLSAEMYHVRHDTSKDQVFILSSARYTEVSNMYRTIQECADILRKVDNK